MKTTFHNDGTFTLEQDGLKKTFKGNLELAKQFFRNWIEYQLK